jgi:hypothetical protein
LTRQCLALDAFEQEEHPIVAKKPGVVKRDRANAPPLKQGKVMPLEPLILGQADAALFLNRSVSWLMQKRDFDLALQNAGRPTEGPRWFTWGGTVAYRVKDLQDWFAAHATERGVVPWRGDAKKAAADGAP